MNYKIIILSAVLLVCSPFVGLAQQSNIVQQRLALDGAITILEDYIVMSTVHDDETYYNFLNLFEKDTTPVYNDLLGFSSSSSIPVNQYVSHLSHGPRNKKVVVSNVRNEGATFTNGMWVVKLAFDKRISYVDSCGTYLSSFEFYDNHDYRLIATINYNPNNHECKITDISGTIDSQNKLSNQYFAFQRTSARDNDLRYKGELLKFNSYDQALLDGTRDPQVLRRDFSYVNSDMELRPQTGDCQVTMRYKMRRFRLRPYFALGLGKAFSRDGDDVFSDSKSTGTSFGVDFGVGIYSKRSFSLGVFTGVGFSMSSMDLSYENKDYSFKTESNADVDGDIYDRHYENLTLNQRLKFSELNIPLYLDFDIKLVKSLSLFVDLGARFDMNMSHKVDATEGSAYVYGMYSEYGNLRLDEQWGFNGFGSHIYNNADLLSSDLIDVKSFTICGLGGFGLRYNLPKIPLSIEAGMNIVMGLTKLIDTSNVSTPNANQIVYNTVSDRESTEHVRNLTEMLKSVKRQQLRISIGLIYRF